MIIDIETIHSKPQKIFRSNCRFSLSPLSTNGGHGKIGFWIKKASSFIILVPITKNKAKKEDEKSMLLGETRINLGRY